MSAPSEPGASRKWSGGGIVLAGVTAFLPALVLLAITSLSEVGDFGIPRDNETLFNIALIAMPVFLLAWSVFVLSRFLASPLVITLVSLPVAAILSAANLLASVAGCALVHST